MDSEYLCVPLVHHFILAVFSAADAFALLSRKTFRILFLSMLRLRAAFFSSSSVKVIFNTVFQEGIASMWYMSQSNNFETGTAAMSFLLKIELVSENTVSTSSSVDPCRQGRQIAQGWQIGRWEKDWFVNVALDNFCEGTHVGGIELLDLGLKQW